MVVRALALLVVLSLPLEQELSAEWNKLEWAGLEVVGDSGTAHLMEVATLLGEAVRLCQRLIPACGDGSAAPFTVIVTNSPPGGKASFDEGLYRSYAIFDARKGHIDKVVLSSMLRNLIRNSADGIPLWVEVGVAEFISSMRVSARGELTIGTPVAQHVLTLRQRPMLSMHAVVGATAESTIFSDLSQRGIFEAQSWAAVHLLTLGDPRRKAQIGSYVHDLVSGASPEKAFERAFQGGPETLGQELAEYAARASFRVHSERNTASESRGLQFTVITESDARMLVADALVQSGDLAGGFIRFQQLPQSAVSLPNPRGLLARLQSLQGSRPDALRIFSESTSHSLADDRWRYYFAVTLLNASPSIVASGAGTTDARRAEQELLELRGRHPRHADVAALLGVTQLLLNNPGAAIKHLSDAFRLCARHEYALLLARALDLIRIGGQVD